MGHGVTTLKKINSVMAELNPKRRIIIWPITLFIGLMIFVFSLTSITDKNNNKLLQRNLNSLSINLEKNLIASTGGLEKAHNYLSSQTILKNNVLALRKFINVERFLVLISMNDRLILTTADQAKAAKTTFKSIREFNLLDHHFKIVVIPTAEWMQDNVATPSYYIFVLGTLFALLAAIIIFLAEKIRRDSYNSSFVKRVLENEIENQMHTENELTDLHRTFDMATHSGHIGVWDWHIQDDKLTWNKMMFEIYGLPPDITPSYEAWRNTLVKEDLIRVETLLDSALKGEAPFNTTFRIKHLNGKISYIFAAGKIEWDKKGNPTRFIGINTDMTQTKKTEEILSSANIGTWEWDLERNEFHLSANFLNMLGYDMKRYSTLSAPEWRELIHPDDVEMYQILLQKHLSGETFYYESEYRIKDNFHRWVWVNDRGKILSRNEKQEPTTMSGIYLDISERKKAEDGIRYLANHDQLTNLSSRRLAIEELQDLIKHAQEKNEVFAVLFIDIDNFKQVNDTFGHAVGDKVIKEFSERLIFCVRESDFIARMGGDEFLAILKDVKSEVNSVRIGQQMVYILGQPYNFDTHMIYVTASIGLSIFPKDGVEVALLLKQADEAMYEVKHANKNNVMAFSTLKNKRLQKPN